jgi:hypothetical protein
MAKSLADIAVGNARPGGLSPVDQIDPELARRILWMHSEMPPNIAAKFNILSGYRSPGRQAQVNPGVKDSQHTHRFAVDTTTDPEVIAWINATKGKYGVNYPLTGMRNEENHMEMIAPGGGRMRGLGSYAKAPSGYKSGLSRSPDTGDQNMDITPPASTEPAPVGPPPDLAGAQAKLAAGQEQADARVAYLKALANQNNPFLSGANSLGSLLTQGMQPAQPDPQPIILPPGAPLPLSRRIS